MAVKLGSVQSGLSLINALFRIGSSKCIRPACETTNLCRYFGSNKLQPPKRPLTAFFDFLGQKRDEIKLNNPGAKVQEVAAIAGQMWKTISEEEKKALQDRAHRRMEAYKVQRLQFLDQLTPAEREELVVSQREHRRKRKHRRHVLELHKLGKPKRPVSPFFVFVRASQVERGDAPIQFVKGLAERWKMMPEEEKEMYREEAQMDTERYYRHMEVWEAKMIKAGRPDLVRGYHKKSRSRRAKRRKNPSKRKARRKSATRNQPDEMYEE
ncbi:transcription factor A, mitochondrial-like isoform X2 [Liolophura sinensis]|uniref:transcription factor A, mitochondrial-like isoform X2 n=1 Tax=Liolophura sinensis TaxID=3198878 RepID=UPI0031592686